MKKPMKIIRNPYSLLFLLASALFVDARLALVGTCDAGTRVYDRREVMAILRSGGFSGVLDNDVELRRIGAIKAGNSCLTLFVYLRVTKSRGGPMGARHMAKRLLVLSKSKYLGMYVIDELPTNVTGNVVEFPGEKAEGNSIVFDTDIPPEKIFLDGEVRRLFK